MSPTFYIKTFGCQMNERDSEIIAQSFGRHDYVETDNIDDADCIILNTCSIRAKAEQKVMSLLGSLRRNKKNNSNLKICVAGCVAQQEGEKIREKMPHVDLVVGTQHIYNIPELLHNRSGTDGIVTNLSDSFSIPRVLPATTGTKMHTHKNEISRFVTIMQGCNNFCTYCVVPYTRGREVSRKAKDIIEEVEVLVESGVKDITLLGQNVNSYGKTNSVTDDDSACHFPHLLRMVAAIPKLKRLRFTTSNPKDLSDELMVCFGDLPNLCPQFHLPVQAGSNSVLRRMNRKYTVEKYIDLVEKLRGYCPEIILTTDIIVGFPGETEDDFEKTMNLLEKVRFDGSFSFKYSDRPGTASTDLSGKVDEKIKSQRLSRFQQRQDEISLERNNSHIGKIFDVIVEENSAPKYQCRAATNHIVHVATDRRFRPGDCFSARIIHAGKHSLQGKHIDDEHQTVQ